MTPSNLFKQSYFIINGKSIRVNVKKGAEMKIEIDLFKQV